MRFHLDENVAHAVADGLRQRGINVTTTADAGLLHASDDQHVAYALREDRVIFTQDRDFLRLHAAGVQHAGIVYCSHGKRTIGQNIRHLCLMHDCLDDDELAGRVEYL
jgi:predicted nuclease of predicted toxin-antitoxin system